MATPTALTVDVETTLAMLARTGELHSVVSGLTGPTKQQALLLHEEQAPAATPAQPTAAAAPKPATWANPAEEATAFSLGFDDPEAYRRFLAANPTAAKVPPHHPPGQPAAKTPPKPSRPPPVPPKAAPAAGGARGRGRAASHRPEGAAAGRRCQAAARPGRPRPDPKRR